MIDRQLLRILRDSIDKAIADLGEEHGVILETGNATFSDNNFTLKIEGSQMVGGNVMTKEAVAYRTYRMHEQTGLELFEEFPYNRMRFKVTGYKTRAKKRPIVCHNLDTGADHVFPTSLVKRLVGMGDAVE
jgi:hypothetical protein